MPRRINAVRPRVKDGREYEKRLRRRILNPLFGQLRSGLAEAAALAEAYAILDGRPPPNLGGIPDEEARLHLARVNGYHRQRLIQTFRAALGVDISGLLQEGPVRQALEARIAENVGLIRTIPVTLHADLRKRLSRELTEAAFDQQRLRGLLNRQFKSTGYNLRRLTRDQTSKAIGQLTQIRQRQIGVEEYRWLTSQDERVRPEHQANGGMVFRWDAPPATGHPGEGIMCRCVAIPVLSDHDRLGTTGPGAALSREAVRRDVASDDFLRFAAGRSLDRRDRAVAVLDPERAATLGYPRRQYAVRLSAESVTDHRERYPGFGADDWLRVQRIADGGEWIKDRPGHRVLWIEEQAGKPWLAAVKRTTNDEIYLTSYRRANRRKIARLRRKGR